MLAKVDAVFSGLAGSVERRRRRKAELLVGRGWVEPVYWREPLGTRAYAVRSLRKSSYRHFCHSLLSFFDLSSSFFDLSSRSLLCLLSSLKNSSVSL